MGYMKHISQKGRNQITKIPEWDILNKMRAPEVRTLAEKLDIKYTNRQEALDLITDLAELRDIVEEDIESDEVAPLD